jgi:MEMO1 family protein
VTAGRRIRPPAVAGLFYPADAERLRGVVEEAMAAALRRTQADSRPDHPSNTVKAVIAPHAGYVYSGPVAASAYAQLAPARGVIKRVVVLGPAHGVPLAAVAVSSADAWETPLGQVEVDTPGRDRLLSLPSVVIDDEAHRREHSLEVHLPFLQLVLGDVAVVPLVAGRVGPEVVADVLDRVWGGPETAIVVSTDLSHYHDHVTASRLDRATAEAIVGRRPGAVAVDGACGVFAVRGLLLAALRRRLDVRLLDLRTSGDTAGTRDRVVGYGAFALSEPAAEAGAAPYKPAAAERRPGLSPADASVLLDLAEQVIRAGLDSRLPREADPAITPAALLEPGGVFVTLEVAGVLNGCIGTIEAVEPLALAVPRLAGAAAFSDPRLPRLAPDDWNDLRIKISLLSPLEPIGAERRDDVERRLRVGLNGLVLAAGRRQATFLPVMWRSLAEPGDFVHHLLRKAGIPTDGWPAGMEAWTYTTVELSRSVSPR